MPTPITWFVVGVLVFQTTFILYDSKFAMKWAYL